jgi:hypothetical protein
VDEKTAALSFRPAFGYTTPPLAARRRESGDEMKAILDPENASPTRSEMQERAALRQPRASNVRKRLQ